MSVFQLDDLHRDRERRGRLYHEFLREPALSAGLYVLPAGGTDPQQPHTEDEIYHIIAGRAEIQIEETTYPVQAGDTIFVPANAPHRFHTISEELHVLVVFGPAEYSRAPAAPEGGSR